jgi:hypothetical protein
MLGPSQLSFPSSNSSPYFSSQTLSDVYSSSPTNIPSSSPSRPPSSLAPDSPLTNIDDESDYYEPSTTQANTYPHAKSTVYIIDTKYDLTKNTTFEPSRKSSVQEIFDYTENERARAENAITPKNLNDFKAKVSWITFYSKN